MASNHSTPVSNTAKTPIRKERDSNMELFRCFATLLVVAVHSNYFSLSVPTTIEAQQAPLPTFTRFFFQAMCIGSVNMFVLISGWFGIRPKMMGFLKLLFQVFFCVTLVYIFLVTLGFETFSPKSLAKTTCIAGSLGWFVRAYIGLYILSPVLNAFIDKATQRQYEAFLAAYFTFQLVCGWVVNSANFGDGYSTASFIFLYLLARYIRIYHTALVQQPPRVIYLAVFLIIVSMQGLVAFAMQYYDIKGGLTLIGRLCAYTSPTVIAMALSMLLYFSRLSFHSRLVNWVAASSLSVYLLHIGLDFTVVRFTNAIRCIYSSYSGVQCLLAFLVFIVFVYVSATLFDMTRIVCWNAIAPILDDFLRKRA